VRDGSRTNDKAGTANNTAQKAVGTATGAADKGAGQATGAVNKTVDTGAGAVNKGVASATGTSAPLPPRLDFSAPKSDVLAYLPPWLVATWAAADSACKTR